MSSTCIAGVVFNKTQTTMFRWHRESRRRHVGNVNHDWRE